MTTNSTAATLIRQLGTALPMLGAHNVVALENGVQFSIRGCKRGNKIVIVLDPSDTYSIALWWIHGADAHEIAGVHFIHADQLHSMLSSLTGATLRNRP
jgi:hypothetical protein